MPRHQRRKSRFRARFSIRPDQCHIIQVIHHSIMGAVDPKSHILLPNLMCSNERLIGAGQNSALPPEGGVPQPAGTPPRARGGSVGVRRNLSRARWLLPPTILRAPTRRSGYEETSQT
jgi:hypothetical protein